MKNIFYSALLLLFLVNANILKALEAVPAEKYFNPTEEVVTPHIKWLKPYASGKIKVLFITYRSGVREMLEIAQRMDLDYKIFAYEFPDKLVREDRTNPIAGTSFLQEKERLEKLLAGNYDLIVMGNVAWKQMPTNCRFMILKKLKQGTGLMGIIQDRDSILEQILKRIALSKDTKAKRADLKQQLASLAYQQLPVFAGNPDIESFLQKFTVGSFKQGRICLFDWPAGGKCFRGAWHPLTPPLKTSAFNVNMNDYDYHMALLIKLALWTAGKEPSIRIRTGGPATGLVFKRAELNGASVDFLPAADQAADSVCRFVLRDNAGKETLSLKKKFKINRGENKLSFALKPVPHGKYFADLWVQNAKGAIVNFASIPVQVDASSYIKEIVLEKDCFQKNEEVKGKIILQNPVSGQKLKIYKADNFGRITAETEIPVSGPETAFSLKAPPAISIVQYIRAELIQDNNAVTARTEKIFSISDFYAPEDEIRLIIWAQVPESYLTLAQLKYFYEAGIDSQYVNFTEWVPMANLWHVPYATRIVDSKTNSYIGATRKKDDLIRDPCLTAPEYLKKMRRKLTDGSKKLSRFSVRDYSLGDEDNFVEGHFDICFSPTCNAAFKRFVEKTYGNIEKLNKEYGTAYGSFQEVDPVSLEKARKTGDIARWVDHRLHMEEVWAGFFASMRDCIQKVVPGARTGYEGSDHEPSTWKADDYWKLAHAMDLNSIYFFPFACAAVKSFLPKRAMFGSGWTGGYNECRSAAWMEYYMWMSLFKGANSYWIWHGSPATGSVTAPDFSFYPFFKSGLKTTKEIKTGIGKSLNQAKRQTDLTFLYSPSSIHCSTFLGEPLGPFADILENYTQLFIDSGFQPGVISYAQARNGELNACPPPLLILPYCQALAPAAVLEIKKYVENGGLLIADVKPAIRDEHGKLLAQGALDEIFGVKTDSRDNFKKGKIEILNKQLPSTAAIPPVCYDSSLTVTTGNPAGKINGKPVIICNRYGKGRAIMLNFIPPEYYQGGKMETSSSGDFASWQKKAAFRNLLTALLAGEKIIPPIAVKPEIPQLEISRFKDQEIEYAGILQGLPKASINYAVGLADIPPAKPIEISFPRQAHIYDVRKKKYLGRNRKIKTAITAGKAMLFALLPYKIDTLKVSLPQTEIKQGGTFNYRVSLAATGNHELGSHIVHIRVFDPAGKEIPYYSSNLNLNNGKAEGKLNFALNAKPGAYKIEMEEIVSGLKQIIEFKVAKQ